MTVIDDQSTTKRCVQGQVMGVLPQVLPRCSLTMKNWQRVMCGKMLCALFLPQETRDCCQKCESCWRSGPLGRRYSTYSLGRGSSRNGSSTWEKSLEPQTQPSQGAAPAATR